jgi:hypothetical protein
MQGGARCVFDSVVLGGAFLFLGDTAVRHDSRSSGPVPISAEVFYNALRFIRSVLDAGRASERRK